MIDLKYYKICATSCSLEVQPNPPLQTQSQGIERKTVVNHPDQLDTIFFFETVVNPDQLDTIVQARITIPDQSTDPPTIDSEQNLVNISNQTSFLSMNQQNI